MSALLQWADVGRLGYAPALKMQERLVEARAAGTVPDTLLLVEHDPVFTLGRRGRPENILASPEERARLGVDVCRTGRGGDVTYHGPGQLVGYPILRLDAWRQGAVWYVGRIEAMLLAVLARFGVRATTDPANRGVWVGDRKIAAIGVRITRQVTMHGFALNVSTDLEYFRHIIPCGIAGKGVTSLHLLAPDVSMGAVKEEVVRQFAQVFGYSSVTAADPAGWLTEG